LSDFCLYNELRLWRLLFVFIASVALTQSCKRKPAKSDMQKLLIAQCDELDIIFYTKDSFVFKNFEPSSIKKYIELITFQNEVSDADCEITERIIFKQKGRQLFTAEISTKGNNDTVSCNSVKYQLDSKEYCHRLTYQTGMGIDEIYWHRVDPQGNPWSGIDTAKFYYESLRSTH
jgi:hypothetical protein